MFNLKESNKKVLKSHLYGNEDYKKLQESLNTRYGIDITNKELFPIMESNFSFKKLQTKLREADASGAFPQFLRAGAQTIMLAAYEAAEVTYEDWVTVVASNKDTELYPINQGVAFPKSVGPQEKYPEVGSVGLDLALKNYKYGSMYSVTKELVDDDQVGVFQRQAALMGQYLKLLTEVLVYGKLQSVANMKYAEFTVPVSETKPSSEANWPYTTSAATFTGGGYNRPTSFGALTQPNIQDGIQKLMTQKNMQGIVMGVNPSRLLIGPHYRFDSAVLANSAYYPSGAACSGAVGGAFAVNPLKGIFDISISRYMPDNAGTFAGDSKAWFLIDDTKPFFIHQTRTPVGLEMEATNSGSSFEMDVYRWKAFTRMNADIMEPRYVWKGSDGSV